MLAQHKRPANPLHAVPELATSLPAAQLTRLDTVKAGLTSKRSRRRVENGREYAAADVLQACPRAGVNSQPWPGQRDRTCKRSATC